MRLHFRDRFARCVVRVAVTVALLAVALTSKAQAMPNFAQAYGVQCSVCHTQVPALNAYGRYIQRTGYAALNPHVLKKEYPLWIDYSTTYTEQTPNAAQWQGGNLGIHADGTLGPGVTNWSYHVQQWLWEGNEPGGLDTAWVAYHNLLGRDGHLFVGKVQSPGPSEYSQWFDVTGLSVNEPAELTVGEHAYQLDANRWGSKFVYDRGSFYGQVAYLTSTADLSGFNDYSNDTDKTLEYQAAFANPKKPLEVGYVGSRGSWPLTEGGVDQYYSNSFYVQRDPVKYIPGVLVTYQMAYDASPGNGAPPSASNGASFEIYDNIGQRGMLSVGKQFTNDGMGNQVQVGNVDASYHVMRFVFVYVEAAFNQQQKPTWNGLIWLPLPIGPI
ncbi:MAG: hypothetical protein WA629_06855 [Candidatus Aquilonibacter sp.]